MAMLMADGNRFGGVRLQLCFDHEEGRSNSAAYTAGDRRGSSQFDERRFSILILKHSFIFEGREGSETEAIHNELVP